MIEFPSKEFTDSCKEELSLKGYCYLRESLSRCGGMTIEFLIEKEEDLERLPVRSRSIWTIFVSDTHPVVRQENEHFFKEEGEIELSSISGKVISGDWLYKATQKLKALVYTKGQPELGAY